MTHRSTLSSKRFFFFVCLFLREVAIAFSGAERGLHGNSVDRLFKVGDV